MECKIIKVLYSNNDYNVAIFKAKNTSDIPKGYSNGADNKFTATGYYPTNQLPLNLSGNWKKTKYGYSYEVSSYKEIMPDTVSGILTYLSSGVIKGIGKKTAKNIVDTFGKDALKVFDEEPEQLLTVKGISPKNYEKIINSYEQTKYVKDIINYLEPFGVSSSKCVSVYKEFKNESINILTNNPYKLCKLKGFTFDLVDNIGKNNDIQLNCESRIKASILSVLSDNLVRGHVCVNKTQLVNSSYKLLNKDIVINGINREVVTREEVKKQVKNMAFNKELKGDFSFVYLPSYYDMEVETAKLVYNKIHMKNLKDISEDKVDKAISKAEENAKITLADNQRKAIKMVMKENFSIITGGAGCGKTTVLKFILEVWNEVTKNNDIMLLAPTGRASRRMGESVDNKYTSSTIHSAFKIADESTNNYETLNPAILFIDEISMCDAKIFHIVMNNIGRNTKVVLIGDPQQLPSVKAGNVLYELLSCSEVPRTKLNVVQRQAGDSLIVTNATNVSNGITDIEYGNDFIIYPTNGDKETLDKTIEVFMNELKDKKSLDKVQILSPIRKNSILCSTTVINNEVQKIVNKTKEFVKRHGVVFKVGDKVIQTKNTEDTSNGDIGYITDITDNDICIKFSEGKFTYDLTNMDIVDLAYATTIHKYQGSEVDTCIIPLHSKMRIMLQRNILYTGITRGKKKVILVGEPEAITYAINKSNIDKRNTFLGKRLEMLFESKKEKQNDKDDYEQLSLF